MAVKLPKIGLFAEIQNAPGFNKALDGVNKRIAESTEKTKEAAKNASPLSNALDKVGVSVDKLLDKVSNLTGINREALDGILNLTQAFGPLGVAIGATVIGVAALAAGFVALGNRGAPLIGLAESFDNLTASVGVSSTTMLKELREASAGTVSDFDLIKRANLALVGSTGEFGREFGQKLPKVLEAARAAARATGQDVDFLFQSLVAGIKRASPRLIDNTGIVLRLSEANEKLAKDLGKSVDQLTEEEKQIAVLNATVDAGQQLIDSLGGSLETNSEKLARSQAIITNTLDALAVAVQPAFGTVLDIVNRILGGFQQLAVGLAPILGSIASIITDVLGGAVNAVLDILQPIFNALTSFLPYIAIVFQTIANIIHGVMQAIGNVVNGIVNFLREAGKQLFGIDVDNLAKSLFEGGAKAFGSFANAIISVANQLIFPAIIGIAKFIADFLIGQSPPPMGPLSKIDTGGANVMKAWLDGLVGVSLDPVEQVAAEVSTALGDIGKASLPVVNTRLKELDAALLPFQQRLEIVKSQFEEISAPAQAALDAIDRQMQIAQEALANGDVQAADTIRQLDAAREAIQGQLDAQQAIVDRQQIQLGLATASQAQERALLNIRKAQLEVLQKAGKAAGQATTGALPKEKKGAGGAAEAPLPTGGASGGISIGDTSALDLIGGQSAVDDAIKGLQDSFTGQLDTSQLELFATNSAELQTQLGRIGSADLGKTLSDKFKGLSDLFNPAIEGSPANAVSKFFSPDPSTPGSLAGFVAGIGPTLDSLKTDATNSANEFFDSIFNPSRAGSPASVVQTLFAGADTQGSIAYTFSQLGPNLQAAAPAIKDQVESAFNDIFDPNVDGSPASVITNLVMTLTGDEQTTDSVASFFSQLPDNVSNALQTIYDKVVGAFEGVFGFFTGQGEGLTLNSILDTAVQFFADLPGKIVTALQGIGATIYAAFAVPVINVINSVIELAENAVKGFLNGVGDFLLSIADNLSNGALGSLIDTSGIRNVANDVKTKAGSVNFGRVSTELPAFLQPAVPGAFAGGVFGPGMLKVGEQGPEYITAATKLAVLPAQLSAVLDGLRSMLAQPAPMTFPGAGDTNYNSSASNYNFYGVQSDNDARRRFNALRAGMP